MRIASRESRCESPVPLSSQPLRPGPPVATLQLAPKVIVLGVSSSLPYFFVGELWQVFTLEFQLSLLWADRSPLRNREIDCRGSALVAQIARCHHDVRRRFESHTPMQIAQCDKHSSLAMQRHVRALSFKGC